MHDTAKFDDTVNKSSAYDLLRNLKGTDISQDICEPGMPAALCVTCGAGEDADSSYGFCSYGKEPFKQKRDRIGLFRKKQSTIKYIERLE